MAGRIKHRPISTVLSSKQRAGRTRNVWRATVRTITVERVEFHVLAAMMPTRILQMAGSIRVLPRSMVPTWILRAMAMPPVQDAMARTLAADRAKYRASDATKRTPTRQNPDGEIRVQQILTEHI